MNMNESERIRTNQNESCLFICCQKQSDCLFRKFVKIRKRQKLVQRGDISNFMYINHVCITNKKHYEQLVKLEQQHWKVCRKNQNRQASTRYYIIVCHVPYTFTKLCMETKSFYPPLFKKQGRHNRVKCFLQHYYYQALAF